MAIEQRHDDRVARQDRTGAVRAGEEDMKHRLGAALAAATLFGGWGIGLAAAQTVTLTQWQTNLRPADLEGINKLIAAFEAKNPGIKIKIEQTPWATHNQKLLAANSAGSGLPDVGRLGDVGQGANVGFIKPLDALVDPAWKATIVDVAWADVTFPREGEKQSHVWAVPKMLATEVWFYNKTMFKKAGLDPDKPPQTIEDFQKAAKALTKDTDGDGRIDQWGVSLTAAAEGGPWRQYISFAKSFGGRLVKTPRYADSEPDEPVTWDSPQTVAAMKWLVGLYKDGLSPPSTISDSVRDTPNNFRAGKVAMVMMGPWEMQATKEAFAKNGWEYGMFRAPQGSAGRGEFMYVGALGLFSQSKNDKEVIQYLKFYTSPEGLGLYMKTNGMIPAGKQALADPYYAEDPLYRVLLETIANADLHSPKWMGLRGATAHFDSVWTPIYQKMLAGDITPEAGVKQMQDSLVKFLK
jgi:multiple sugar transport system substrate-binding protein